MTRTPKALAADDSNISLLMLSHMLKRCGIAHVTEVTDGLQAVQEFQKAIHDGSLFDFVFLDVVMPVMDGQEALRLMRVLETTASVPAERRAVIVMATSLNSPGDMATALIEGDCNDYLVKPVKLEDVRAMITRYAQEPPPDPD